LDSSTRMVRKLNNTKEKRISPNSVAIIGTVLILIGGFFLSYNYLEAKKVVAYDYVANMFYSKKDQVVTTSDGLPETASTTITTTAQADSSGYIGYLIIPKINLTKGFVAMDSADNDVEKNIYLVSGSTYPDTPKGNLIIAGHSGTGWKAFFNDLEKLTINDIAKVTYNNKTYTYQITKIYKQTKTGKIAIYRNYAKTTLTLITCTNNDSTTQTVYIAELIKTE
jgi:LPXTG-site transpeptidase (sortase) family protein